MGVAPGRFGDLSSPGFDSRGSPTGGAGEGGLLGEMRQTVGRDRLFQIVDAVLDYPAAFIAADIEGDVSATLVFSDEGLFLPKPSRVNAASPYLRVVVLQVLRRALADAIPSARRLRVRCLFTFGGSDYGIRTGVAGNHLAFHRESPRRAPVLKLGPLALGFRPRPTHLTGGPPSVGVGASLDVGWIVEAFRGSSGENPLASYRADPEWAK